MIKNVFGWLLFKSFFRVFIYVLYKLEIKMYIINSCIIYVLDINMYVWIKVF